MTTATVRRTSAPQSCRGGAPAGPSTSKSPVGEFSRGKTIFVLAVVIGCFAILWPKIFYPMLTASLNINPGGDEQCCDVISDKDVNAYKLMKEICDKILSIEDTGVPPVPGISEMPNIGQGKKQAKPLRYVPVPPPNVRCRNEILKSCGIDVSTLIQENPMITKQYKSSLASLRSYNTSQCLKVHYSLDYMALGLPRRFKDAQEGPSHMRPERPNRPERLHPAMREKGSAIPHPGHLGPHPGMISQVGHNGPPDGPSHRTLEKEARPGVFPGVRPTVGGAGFQAAQPKGGGTMGIIMPIYTIAIVVFFVYTIMKILFRKSDDQPPIPPILKDYHMDPAQRKYVLAEEYQAGSERSMKEVFNKEDREAGVRRKPSGSKQRFQESRSRLEEDDKMGEIDARQDGPKTTTLSPSPQQQLQGQGNASGGLEQQPEEKVVEDVATNAFITATTSGRLDQEYSTEDARNERVAEIADFKDNDKVQQLSQEVGEEIVVEPTTQMILENSGTEDSRSHVAAEQPLIAKSSPPTEANISEVKPVDAESQVTNEASQIDVTDDVLQEKQTESIQVNPTSADTLDLGVRKTVAFGPNTEADPNSKDQSSTAITDPNLEDVMLIASELVDTTIETVLKALAPTLTDSPLTDEPLSAVGDIEVAKAEHESSPTTKTSSPSGPVQIEPKNTEAVQHTISEPSEPVLSFATSESFVEETPLPTFTVTEVLKDQIERTTQLTFKSSSSTDDIDSIVKDVIGQIHDASATSLGPQDRDAIVTAVKGILAGLDKPAKPRVPLKPENSNEKSYPCSTTTESRKDSSSSGDEGKVAQRPQPPSAHAKEAKKSALKSSPSEDKENLPAELDVGRTGVAKKEVKILDIPSVLDRTSSAEISEEEVEAEEVEIVEDEDTEEEEEEDPFDYKRPPTPPKSKKHTAVVATPPPLVVSNFAQLLTERLLQEGESRAASAMATTEQGAGTQSRPMSPPMVASVVNFEGSLEMQNGRKLRSPTPPNVRTSTMSPVPPAPAAVKVEEEKEIPSIFLQGRIPPQAKQVLISGLTDQRDEVAKKAVKVEAPAVDQDEVTDDSVSVPVVLSGKVTLSVITASGDDQPTEAASISFDDKGGRDDAQNSGDANEHFTTAEKYEGPALATQDETEQDISALEGLADEDYDLEEDVSYDEDDEEDDADYEPNIAVKSKLS